MRKYINIKVEINLLVMPMGRLMKEMRRENVIFFSTTFMHLMYGKPILIFIQENLCVPKVGNPVYGGLPNLLITNSSIHN